MGRKVLLPVSGASAAEHHSTSFKHALFWLMRNLLKIPRRFAGVNGGDLFLPTRPGVRPYPPIVAATGFLFCIRARLQSCRNCAGRSRALARALCLLEFGAEFIVAGGKSPDHSGPGGGTTKVVP